METKQLSRDEKVAIYTRIITAHPGAALKGKNILYTSLNGHMYSMLTKNDEIALRLPAAERIKFIADHKAALLEQYGIVQKEYAVVPDRLLKNTDELTGYFNLSYEYARSLKPKAAAKK